MWRKDAHVIKLGKIKVTITYEIIIALRLRVPKGIFACWQPFRPGVLLKRRYNWNRQVKIQMVAM